MNKNIYHPPPMNISQEKYQLEIVTKLQEDGQGLQVKYSGASLLQKVAAQEVELQQDLSTEKTLEADNMVVQ